jgi:7-alpha-hydroxysteroid dehydrogenase
MKPRSEHRLAGRVAIVTGASRGLGKAMAEAFGREGASVVVAARTEKVWDERLPGTIFETAANINDAGGRAIAVRCDVAVETDLEALVAATHAAFGSVDLLVNNSALTVPGRPGGPAAPRSGMAATAAPADGADTSTRVAIADDRRDGSGVSQSVALAGFLSFPTRGLRRNFDINVFGPYRLMQLVAPDMMAKGSGAIINISSGASTMPGEGPYDGGGMNLLGYSSTKVALERLTQWVARDLAPHGIAVNALLPSTPIESPGVAWLGGFNADEVAKPEPFAEAAIRLAIADPAVMSGWIAYHLDILNPDLPRRGPIL